MNPPSRFRPLLLRIAACAALATGAGEVTAISVWVGGTGDWNDAAMWVPPGVPTAADDVYIDDGKVGNPSIAMMYPTAYTNEQHARNLTIDLGDALIIQNNRRLTLQGDTVLNNGMLELQSAGATTGIILTADNTAFSGAGTLLMTGDNANAVVGRSNYLFTPSQLTNGALHTIRGTGRLGTNENVNAIGLDNLGLIVADANSSPAQPLIINLHPDATVRRNTGTMRARDGGQLEFYASVLGNGNLVEAVNGSSVLLVGSTIEGGILRTDGSSSIDLQNLTVTLSGLRDVRLEGQARVLNGKGAFLAGVIDNAGGDIRLDSTGASTSLRIDGDVTLAGNGSLTLSDSALNFISGTANTDILTQDAAHTVQGSGVIGGSAAGAQIGLDNRGTIIANNAANALTMNLSDGAGVTRSNSGTLRSDLGGQFTLQGTVLDNAGGKIEARDGSTVLLINSTINDGDVWTFGSGELDMRNDSRLVDVTVHSQVVMLNGYRSYLQGTITNHGNIRLDASTGSTDLKIDGNVTLAGTGVLSTTDDTGNRITGVASANMLTNGPLHTIRGSGSIGTTTAGIGLLNQGLIDASQTNKLSIDPSAAAGVVVNTGTLRGSGIGGLELKGGDFDNQGFVEALDGSSVTYTTTAVTLNNSSGRLAGGVWRAASEGAGAVLTLRGDAITTNQAEVYLKGLGSVIQVGATPIDDTLQINEGELFITDGRVFQVAAGNGDFANAGKLQLDSQGVFRATSLNNTGGVLTGSDGVLQANVFGPGTIKPGHSTGHLTIDGNLQQDAGGTMVFELASLGDFDRLTVTGDVEFGGELAIRNAGYTPSVGDSFVLMTFGQRLGDSEFDSMSLDGFGSGVVLAATYHANDLTLEVAAVPEPGIWAMMLAGIGLLGLLAARRMHGADRIDAA